jgi:CRISPR-associated protein Cmr6
MDAKTLASLEATIWGDVNGSGAVRLQVTPLSKITPVPYDKEFLSQRNQLPAPPNQKTTQGLAYHSFGMDDRRRDAGVSRRFQRYFLALETRWALQLTARPTRYEKRDANGNVVQSIDLTDPTIALQQAEAALWLLCTYGGVGSKSRKGFGSFAEPAELASWNQDQCKKVARKLRELCHLPMPPSSFLGAGSAALEQMLPPLEIPTPWTNYWYALDRVGAAAQSFAQAHKHDQAKKALGLPRRVLGQGAFRPGRHVVQDRHASPVFYHLGKTPKGYVVRVAAFPASELPSLAVSRAFLQQLLERLRILVEEVTKYPSKGRQAIVNSPTAPANTKAIVTGPPAAQSAAPTLPKVNDRVEAQLLEEKTRKGGWRAKHLKSGVAGPILNSAAVPADKKAGEKILLIVKSVNPKEIAFAWPV